MKRAFDIILSITVLLITLPFLIILAIIIFIDDRGNPIFKQKRVGLNCETFNIYKFRSMKTNASSLGPYYTQDNDSRVTRIGRFIRRTSIDELPQLINVLLGDMSIVGPRPDVPDQQSSYIESDWKKRHLVKPGITGLSQSTLRSDASPSERLKNDLDYVEEHNFRIDMKIIYLTIIQLLKKGGN